LPYSLNGIGSQLIPASRRRINNGQIQFDAVEAGTFLFLPFIPTKALHILDIQSNESNLFDHQYQFQLMPLRMSWRIIFKAFLNRWGNCLGLLGGVVLVIDIFRSSILKIPEVGSSRDIMLNIFGTMLVVGVVSKIGWWMLSRKDEKIKNLIGSHAFGSSDPLDWLYTQAEPMARSILQEESLPSLVAVAQQAVNKGERSYAALCLRLAMRDPNCIEAQDMMDHLMMS
jgi:hypothetical protein